MASVDTEDDQLLSVIYGDHESDDWAAKHQISLSEHASRLNAKQHFDNRGRQIWTDGAEEVVLQWNPTAMPPTIISRSTNCAWRGAASCLHNHPLPGAGTAYMTKLFYNPGTGRFGIEIAVSMDRIDFDNIRFRFGCFTGAVFVHGTLIIQGNTGNLQYLDDVNAAVNLGAIMCLQGDIHYWHKIKVVIDIDLLEYVRILVDGNEFNMQGIPCNAANNLACSHLQAMFYSTGDGVNVHNIYWDDFILTHLEP